MPSLVEAVLLWRAEEQVATAWSVRYEGIHRQPGPAAAAEPETKREPRYCQVPGCTNEIVGRRSRAEMCMACFKAGWTPTPCQCCGGRMRDIDRRHTPKGRRRMCQTCRADLPQIRRGWPPGQSGNPSGKPRTREFRPEAA